MPHSAVSPQNRSKAKLLRHTMTRAETLLWRYVKAGHLEGLSFRRQAPMGPYIVDFVCHAARLVIEIDGETHDFAERLRRDQARDAWLASRGYIVKRFTNDDVLKSLEGVLTVLRKVATDRIRSAPPSLSLPRKGGGNPQTTAVRVASIRRKRVAGARQ
jgi:very-short-patch-repair endonuclease